MTKPEPGPRWRRGVSEIGRILFPIYDLDEPNPGFEHAIWMARKFKARLLVAAVVRRDLFFRPMPAGGGIPPVSTGLAEEKLVRFREELNALAGQLAEEAVGKGISAEARRIEEPFEEAVATLTRSCDLVVESRLHRHSIWGRLFGEKDIYTESHCPILISRGRPFRLSPLLLVYNESKQANAALRRVTRMLKKGRTKKVHVVVSAGGDRGCDRLAREVTEYTEAHGVALQITPVKSGAAFEKVVEKSVELKTALVAMPAYAFDRPFKFRLKGIDEESLGRIRSSVLLFP